MLDIQEKRSFTRAVQFKDPSPEGRGTFKTQTFGVRFKIMATEVQLGLMARAKEAIGEQDFSQILDVLDEIVDGYEDIKKSGVDVTFDEAHAYVKSYPDIAEAVVNEYNMAMKETGNVKAKNSRR